MITLKKRRTIINAAVSAVAVLLGIIVVFPVIYCVCGAFKTPSEFLTPKLIPHSFAYIQNFREALDKGNLLRYTLNSFIVSFFGTVIRLVISILAAYTFAYYDFSGKNFFFFFLLGTMMIPSDILLATNYLTVSRLHLLNTYIGCMAVSFVSASQMLMLRQCFLGVPKDMKEASQIDGYGDLYYITSVLIPVCRPVITALFVQSFISIWNAYLWPLIVTAGRSDMRTVIVGITKLNSWEDENYNLVLAGVCISLVPSMFFFIIMRRNMRKGGFDGSIVG